MPWLAPVIGLSIATKDEEKTIMRRHITVNRCFLFLLVAAPLLAAQPGDRSGIDGFVTRDMAAAVSGATIGIDKRTGGFHRQTTTDTSGYYLIDDLEPGGYSVWAEITMLWVHQLSARSTLSGRTRSSGFSLRTCQA
jgi:hypothetical protein